MEGAIDYLAMQARSQPARPAVRDLNAGRSWTYWEFDLEASRFAAALAARGVAAGDRVAMLAKNRAELLLTHLACARLGAMAVPLNWRLAAVELAALMADAEPILILGDALLAAAGVEGVPFDLFAAEAAACAPLADRHIDADTPSLILYTSGTSGRSKGVLLSERNIWQTGLNFSLLGRVTHDSVMLCDAPMFHVVGLVTNIRPALMRGGACLISGGFAAPRTLARLYDPALGVTHYFGVPQMMASLRADPSFDAAKLRHLTGMFTGGAPHAPDAIRAWTRDGIPMADGFGMSETGTVSCMPLELDLIDRHAGAAGLVAPGLGVRIMDEKDGVCAPGEAGEIFLKGPNVTCGYWRRPAETQNAFDAQGWLRSGDIGRLDEDGYLWLVDRKKDMFISGGENVYPAEIESALAAFPGLADCAVVGVPDEKWGEVGSLAIVALPERQIVPADVMAYLEARLARYKLPKHVTVLKDLPRNGAGKLVKAKLRDVLEEKSLMS